MASHENSWDKLLQIKSCGRDESGADEYHHPYEPTPYCVLERLVKSRFFGEEDVVLDYGCGKGRVLAFLLKKQAPCPLYGIEINEISGKIALEWSEKYDRVSVTIGDAFQIDYNPYTVLFLGRPFLPKTFLEFIERLEATLTHPITFIYWVDQQSGYMLKERSGWEMHFREKLSTIHELKIARVPQSYSIWTYDPQKRQERIVGHA